MNFELFNHPYTLPIGAAIAVATFVISGFTAWNDVKSDIRNANTVSQSRYETYLHHEVADEAARRDASDRAALDKREIRGDIRELRNLIMIPPDRRVAQVEKHGFPRDQAVDHGQK